MACDRRRWCRRPSDDRGAVVVLVAAMTGALFVLVALVLDHSGARRDRDADQLSADAMALSGAGKLIGRTGAGKLACEAAWDYIVINLPTARSKPAPSCSTFSTTCVPATARQVQTTISEYVITFTHPVPAGHALLAGQPASNLDGSACDRFGVQVEQTRSNMVARGSVAIDVRAVGRYIKGVGNVHAPLVLLAERACGVLTVNGNAALTVNTASGEPGYIAIDSDGADCSNPNKVVLDVNGQGSVTAGKIAMWALADGDPTSAYSNGLLSPTPVAAEAPVTRKAMDWRYNCDPAAGCPGAGPPHIDNLIADYGGSGSPLPAGTFTSWTGSGRSCSPSGATVVPAGNWYIDCGSSGLSTSGSLTFQGGNIVSDGPVKASGAGGLRINCSDSDPTDLIAPTTCATDPPNPSILYLRSGDLIDNGSVEMRETMVYLNTGKVTMSGNNTLTWTAPDDITHRFDDLLLWTTNTSLMKITGNTTINLEGTLFMPNAEIELAGSNGSQAMGAQIFAHKAKLAGGASLTLTPKTDRMGSVGRGRPLLIR